MTKPRSSEAATISHPVFTLEELAMLRFLELCQPSLDQRRYAAVVDACQYLCDVRNDLDAGSLDKCLDYWRGLAGEPMDDQHGDDVKLLEAVVFGVLFGLTVLLGISFTGALWTRLVVEKN
jgi:hypothetical protein